MLILLVLHDREKLIKMCKQIFGPADSKWKKLERFLMNTKLENSSKPNTEDSLAFKTT